jgi:hypothetical protein
MTLYLVTQPIENPVIKSHNHQSIEKDLEIPQHGQIDRIPENSLILLIVEFSQAEHRKECEE